MDRGDFFAAVFPYQVHRLSARNSWLAEYCFFAYDPILT